ncbi:hypothetical protein EYF80_028969 [Liparis tanakae]|uniref:Uncharacterized protein n=1 Tax=Liparis tanakae TaxID=230148 RepID=A0A4Z2H4V6_9TELE|nr:hypothetical protein EYF80_028969 [Liparis tanakae]
MSHREKQWWQTSADTLLDTTQASGAAQYTSSPLWTRTAARRPLPFPGLTKRSSFGAIFGFPGFFPPAPREPSSVYIRNVTDARGGSMIAACSTWRRGPPGAISSWNIVPGSSGARWSPQRHAAGPKVGIPGEVLADRGVDVSQGAVESGAAHTDHYSDQTQQEEEQAGVPTANIYREGGREGGSLLLLIHGFRVQLLELHICPTGQSLHWESFLTESRASFLLPLLLLFFLSLVFHFHSLGCLLHLPLFFGPLCLLFLCGTQISSLLLCGLGLIYFSRCGGV